MGVLSNIEAEKMYVEYPTMPIFHSFPTLHKGIFPHPLRLIVAGIGSMGEPLGAWLDSFLQPLSSLSPAHIKDTKHLVTMLDGQGWKKSLSWLSCDVTALYPSIPHDRALQILSMFLCRYSPYSIQLKEFLQMVTEFLLKHNFFMFDDEYYLQLVGVPMGGKHIPLSMGRTRHLLGEQSLNLPYQMVRKIYEQPPPDCQDLR